jgi:hypothetical protein
MKMRFPIEKVFRRGAVFRQGLFDKLDDPALAGRTKPKYFVVLSTAPQDDPILYVLTTSEKEKHEGLPFLVAIEAGVYDFFPVKTLIDVATAENLDIPRDGFLALYEIDEIEYQGTLSSEDIKRVVDAIKACSVISNRFKQTLG